MITDNIIYDRNEETRLAGEQNQNTTEWQATQIDNAVTENGWRKVAIGGVTGIVLGAGAVLLTSGKPLDSKSDSDADRTSHPIVDKDISLATTVGDDMSFSEAFHAARAEVGSGGAFEWHGRLYNTFTADEWDSMSATDKSEYASHFDWGDTKPDYSVHHTAQHSPDQQATATNAGALASHDVHNTSSAGQGQIATTETEEPHEVEVLGVVHDPETGANIGAMTIDGQEVAVVDIDNDKTFDAMISDFNNDGQIQENEVVDISEGNVTVDDLGGFTPGYGDNSYASDDGSGYTDDGSDYLVSM